MDQRWIISGGVLCAAAVLAGCTTGPRLVEGQVQSYSTLPAATAAAPTSYRIERLPSQQAPSFAPIEALAEQALARAGLTRNDAAPQLLVQIGVQADSVPRYDPFLPYGASPWRFSGWYGRGWGLQGGLGYYQPTPLYRRAVSVVMRDAATQATVYETSAVHEDVWTQDPAVYGVLLEAALTGYPHPPAGPRQVRLPMPAAATNPTASPSPAMAPAQTPTTAAPRPTTP